MNLHWSFLVFKIYLHWLFLDEYTQIVFSAFIWIYTRCFSDFGCIYSNFFKTFWIFTLTVFMDFGWIYTACFYFFCMDLAELLFFAFVAVKNTFVAGKPKFCNKRNLFVDEKIKLCLRKKCCSK